MRSKIERTTKWRASNRQKFNEQRRQTYRKDMARKQGRTNVKIQKRSPKYETPRQNLYQIPPPPVDPAHHLFCDFPPFAAYHDYAVERFLNLLMNNVVIVVVKHGRIRRETLLQEREPNVCHKHARAD